MQETGSRFREANLDAGRGMHSGRIYDFLNNGHWRNVPETFVILQKLYDLAIKKIAAAKAAEPGSRQWARDLFEASFLMRSTPLGYLPFLDEDSNLYVGVEGNGHGLPQEILGDEVLVCQHDIEQEMDNWGLVDKWYSCQSDKSFAPVDQFPNRSKMVN